MKPSYRRRRVFFWLVAVVAGWAHAAHGVWVAGGTNFGGVFGLVVDPSRPSTVYVSFNGFGHGLLGNSTNGGGRWQKIGTPAESFGAVLVDPTHPNTVFAGSVKTTDGGLTWSGGAVPLRGTPAALVMQPSDSNTLYAALYDTLFADGSTDDGVYKTTDAGNTWVPAKAGLLRGVNYESIVIDPTTPSTLYTTALGGGVFKTTNAGGNWSPADAGLPNVSTIGLVMDPADASTLYVGTEGGVYKSTNAAASWQPTGSGISPIEVVGSLAIAPTDPATLYAATFDTAFTLGRVVRTTDGGGHWSGLTDGLPPTAIINALAVDPTDAGVAYAGETIGDVYTLVGLCGLAPQTGCKRPVKAGAATVSLARGRTASGDALSWNWTKGAVTTSDELGDPTAQTNYTLCVYDGTSKLVFWTSAPAGGTCGKKPCWKATKSGFTYTNTSKLPRGIKTVALAQNAVPGKAKVTVSASGVNLAPPSLPLNQSAAVTVQLINGDGTCWEATYSMATKNTATQFKAKSD